MRNITSATTKDELMKTMKGILPKLRKLTTKQAKDLADTISYASNMYKKDPAKVTKKDMLSALTLADKLLAVPASASSEKATPKTEKAAEKKPALTKNGQKVAEKKTENLTKKTSTSKVAESKSDAKETTKAPAKGKTSEKKPADKKQATSKKSEVKTEEKKTIFPENFTTETEDGEVTYELCADIKSMDELVKLLSNEDDTYIIAWYYPKNAIKQYYPRGIEKARSVKSFENDLDLSVPVYVSDDNAVIYCVSLYTEVFYDIMPEEITEGDKFAGGIPYQIYKEA